MTIREQINGYRDELLKDLQPDRASEILKEMSALMGNISDEILKNEVAYNKVLLECLKNEKSANKAKITADITEEYINLKTARNTEKNATEMIRSLKYFIRQKEEEYRQMKNF